MANEATGKGQSGRLPTRYAGEFHTFRTEMDRLFDSFLKSMPALTNFRQAFPAAQGLTPAWDVKETEKEPAVKAELPGIDDRARKRANAATGAKIIILWNEAMEHSGARSAYPKPSIKTRLRPVSIRACWR